jgi:uncharacterized Zn finger protein
MGWRNRRYYDFDDFYPRFPRSQPRKAKGGIKAQSQRGRFGESWWARRWIAVLESFQIGGRLGRGRSYARNGQVVSIEIGTGEVQSQVQGSRPKPYDVTINVKELTDKEWSTAIDALGSQALFLAKLLAGEMPQDIEKVFDDAGVSLFPAHLDDLETECSCPDYSNPCKHIAAVYYLLGEEFDRDPFLIFKLRGLDREKLLARLQEAAPAAAGDSVAEDRARPPSAGEPLPTDPTVFWQVGEMPADLFEGYQAPPMTGAWLRRLGGFPFWRGRERFLDALLPIYRQAGETGLQVFVGQSALRAKA